mgnify:CR=1 FL=1
MSVSAVPSERTAEMIRTLQTVYLSMHRSEENDGTEIEIDGGRGVGRVTKNGLDQPVGAAAINKVPRQMIRKEAEEICDCYGYEGGLEIIISIPGRRTACEEDVQS